MLFEQTPFLYISSPFGFLPGVDFPLTYQKQQLSVCHSLLAAFYFSLLDLASRLKHSFLKHILSVLFPNWLFPNWLFPNWDELPLYS